MLLFLLRPCLLFRRRIPATPTTEQTFQNDRSRRKRPDPPPYRWL